MGKIYTSIPTDEESEEKIEEPEENQRQAIGVASVAVDPNMRGKVYIGTSRGVFTTSEARRGWERVTSYGLLQQDVRFLIVDNSSVLYALTSAGIFVFRGSRWEELSLRLTAGAVYGMVLDAQGIMYVAADKGLFRSRISERNDTAGMKRMESYAKDEPAIRQVQEAAIAYAEVQPEKIALWRKQAVKKAFFPKVSAGLSRNTGDLWHWELGSTTKAGDDTLCRGRDSMDWDVTLSWDLGEIIWNGYQTLIDTRSKLMEQLGLQGISLHPI